MRRVSAPAWFPASEYSHVSSEVGSAPQVSHWVTLTEIGVRTPLTSQSVWTTWPGATVLSRLTAR